MFDRELREEKNFINTLQNNIKRTISEYEYKLRDIKRNFDNVYYFGEKEIEKLLQQFESNIKNMIKNLEFNFKNESTTYIKLIDEIEKKLFDSLEKHKYDVKIDFDSKIDSLFIIKGEL